MIPSAHLDLVTALRAVAGVADAEVVGAVAGPQGVVGGELAVGADAGTLRLSLLPGADEVAVATEVNHILREQFGLAVDAGRVQIVEEPAPPPVRRLASVGDSGAAPASAPVTAAPQWSADLPVVTRGGRLLIHRMQVVSAGVGVTTAVTLGFGASTYVGEAEGLSTAPSVQRCVAEATLRAVEEVAGDRASFRLDDVDIVRLGGDQVVVVCVEMTAEWGTERLMGASAVREDARQAVIRATLDSLNRRLEAVLVR